MSTPVPDPQSGLADLVNTPITVNAFGKIYEIKQLSIGQAFQASAHIARLALAFETWPQIMALPTAQERIANIMEVISFSEDSVVGLISVAIHEPAEWVKDQNSMEALDVIAAVVEKNLPLFSPENIERIKGKFGGLVERMSALGGATSTSSSSTDTAH